MICEGCIHKKVCGIDSAFFIACFGSFEKCNDFKDKSLYIELPCKVGDTVYRKRNNGNALKKHDNVSLCWILNHIEEFGVNCFLSLEEFEAKELK